MIGGKAAPIETYISGTIGDAVRGRPVGDDEDRMKGGAFLVRDGLLLLRQPAVLHPVERETNVEISGCNLVSYRHSARCPLSDRFSPRVHSEYCSGQV